MTIKSKSLNKTVKKSLLAMIAFTVLLTPISGFAAERDGSVLFFSLEDLQQTLSNPTAPSFSDWSSNFAWRNQREQDQPGPVERNYNWGNRLGFDGYADPGNRPLWGY